MWRKPTVPRYRPVQPVRRTGIHLGKATTMSKKSSSSGGHAEISTPHADKETTSMRQQSNSRGGLLGVVPPKRTAARGLMVALLSLSAFTADVHAQEDPATALLAAGVEIGRASCRER